MLLPGVRFSAGFEPPFEEISARERTKVAAASAWRLREFAAGRWHARRALQALGIDGADLPRRGDGAPAWPPGVIGSISHTVHCGRLFAVAAVAEAALFAGLGVDVEAPGQIEARFWPTVFLPDELDALLRTPVPQRGLAASKLWSAKEAAFKASGDRAGLDSISISLEAPNADFAATSACGSVTCVGKVVATAGWVFAVAGRQDDHRHRTTPFPHSVARSESAATASSVTSACAGPASRGVMS